MTRAEVDELVNWAAAERWNPGLHDADCFWATDPAAFIAAEQHGVLIGGGAITSYAGEFGFMGFFIVRPSFRGRGIGNRLWHARRERLLARLQPGASVGLDGVFEMQDYYARGGFLFSHRNIRFRAEVPAGSSERRRVDDEPDSPNQTGAIQPLAAVPFDTLAAYDRSCFPAAREAFLRAWTNQPDALALGAMQADQLQGYGVIRRCREGCKIGPLFANDGSIASALFDRLADFAAGGPVFIDVPETNGPAMALVQQRAMVEVFGCARMYLGPVPRIHHDRVFGVTTFELG